MSYNRNIGLRLMALLSTALWLCVPSITPAQTAASSTAQAGSVVSNGPAATAAVSQSATNPPALKHGHLVPLDQDRAELRKEAEAGDAAAQYLLGFIYDRGLGVSQDYNEAVKWYRKAAEQGHLLAQYDLGAIYAAGHGVPQDYAEAVKWYRKAAEQGSTDAQVELGILYLSNHGAAQDHNAEAAKWFRKAADQGIPEAQTWLATLYATGHGVPQDYAEAVKWNRRAAEQGGVLAQCALGDSYERGQGVPQDYIEAYKWYNLAAAYGSKTLESAGITSPSQLRDNIAALMTPEQIAEGQRRASQFVARQEGVATPDQGSQPSTGVTPRGNGTGFLIAGGYILTSYHVVKDANSVEILSGGSRRRAKVVKVDPANDLALLWTAQDPLLAKLKQRLAAEGVIVTNQSAALPVLSSRDVHLGDPVFTLGFPNIDLQGIEPKLTRGEINSLSGIQDDVRFFQISAAVQPGNSGGSLVDVRGNVVGIVAARLDDLTALETSGALPQNVNYALKGSQLIAFLDSVPELAGKLKEPHTETNRPFADVVKEVQNATVMVIVY